jgi:hypothetical protein
MASSTAVAIDDVTGWDGSALATFTGRRGGPYDDDDDNDGTAADGDEEVDPGQNPTPSHVIRRQPFGVSVTVNMWGLSSSWAHTCITLSMWSELWGPVGAHITSERPAAKAMYNSSWSVVCSSTQHPDAINYRNDVTFDI